MRVGVHLGQAARIAHPAAVKAIAVAAEQVGYASVWAGERAPTDLESLQAGGLAAAATGTIGVGALLDPESGSPAALATSVLELADECDGRLRIAVARPADPEVRELLDELLARQPGHHRVDVLIAGGSPAVVHLAATRGDGWVPCGVRPEAVGELWGEIRRLAHDLGRDAEDLSLVVPVVMDVSERADGGDWCGEVIDEVDVLRRAGASEVVLAVAGDPCLDDILAAYAAVAEEIETRVAGQRPASPSASAASESRRATP